MYTYRVVKNFHKNLKTISEYTESTVLIKMFWLKKKYSSRDTVPVPHIRYIPKVWAVPLPFCKNSSWKIFYLDIGWPVVSGESPVDYSSVRCLVTMACQQSTMYQIFGVSSCCRSTSGKRPLTYSLEIVYIYINYKQTMRKITLCASVSIFKRRQIKN